MAKRNTKTENESVSVSGNDSDSDSDSDIRKQDDSLWKSMIEDLFPDFIRFFYPEDCETFDLQHFDFLDKEFQKMFPDIETGTDKRFVDKLVKVRRKTGTEQWILVHIEIQGYADPDFPERMLTYWTRVRDRYKQPITAIAIFTDAKNKIPDHFKSEVLGTRLEYHYNTYRIYDQPDDKLRESKNPFALIAQAAKTALVSGKMTDRELMSRHEWLFQALEGIKLSERKQIAVFTFLKNSIHFSDSKTYIIFGKKLDTITGKKNAMGVKELLLERGREEGMEKGEKRGMKKGEKRGMEKGEKRGMEKGEKRGMEKKSVLVVKNLLATNQYTIAKISDLVKVSQGFVRKVKKGIITE